MRYSLLIYNDEDAWANASQEKRDEVYAAHATMDAELRRRNAFVCGFELAPTSSTTTLHVKNGEVLTTDGPFAETKEALAGFYLIDCKDLDEAMEFAAMIPMTANFPPGGNVAVEIRPQAD
jgi:hypothetical protein